MSAWSRVTRAAKSFSVSWTNKCHTEAENVPSWRERGYRCCFLSARSSVARQGVAHFWPLSRFAGRPRTSRAENLSCQSGNLSSKRMAGWLRILAQLAMGMVHFFLIASASFSCVSGVIEQESGAEMPRHRSIDYALPSPGFALLFPCHPFICTFAKIRDGSCSG